MASKQIKESFRVGDIWPKANEEGWGDTTKDVLFTTRHGCQSIGNCGLVVINDINIHDTFHDSFPISVCPVEHRKSIMDQWGGASAGWTVAIDNFKEKWYRANQERLFRLLAEAIPTMNAYHCYVMTDGVNKHSSVRLRLSSYVWKPTTSWFCRMLIKHKVGYVVQSPLVSNRAHASPTDFGWIRTWTWFPEGAWVYKPEKYLGYGKIIDKEELMKKINNHGNFRTNKLSNEVLERDYLNSYKIP